MRFDLASFLIGFVIAAVVALLMYRFRAVLARLRGSAQARAGSTRQFLSNSSDKRYSEEFTRFANRYHLAGDKVPLSEVYVEPRFIPAIEPVELDETTKIGSIFHVIPQVRDLPAVYSPYNINTLTISDLRWGERRLVFLGLPGAGKSTALAIMALYANSQVDLRTLDSLAEQVQLDEDKDLNETERAERARQRKDQQDRALAQLRVTQDREADAKAQKKIIERDPVDFKTLMPILVHLRDIDLTPEAYGGKSDAAGKAPLKTLDPAEPLVKAITRRFSVVAANTIPRLVYSRLAAGRCLVMLDGFDEIGSAYWPEKLAWLDQFLAMYPENFVIITGPIKGYDPLVNAGFTPLFVRPWADQDFEALVERWAAAWPRMGGTQRNRVPAPDEKIVKRVMTNNRGRTPLDVTLKAWAAFAGDEQQIGRLGAYDYYVRSQLDDFDRQRSALDLIAAETLDQGLAPIRKDRIIDLITPLLTGENGKPLVNIGEFVDKLVGKNGLFLESSGSTYLFRHPLIAGYLGAEAMTNAPSTRIEEIAQKPIWELALPFMAGMIPMDAAVTERLGTPPDLLFNNWFEIAHWLPEAPADATWRNGIINRLQTLLLSPSQYPAIRERALAALITSRHPNIIFVMRQALESPDPMVRRLGCVGLGALGDAEAIKDLTGMLNDKDPDVQLAAGLALGSLNNERAMDMMMDGFLNGEEGLRRAIAESFAAIPNGGHELLSEGIHSQDMYLRRASVFGLSRIKAPWALALLYRAMLEDSEWYVRSAADMAFRQAEKPEGVGPVSHPDAESLPWLIAWAATKGEGVPAGPNARQVLIHALQEGDPLHRAAAALTIAYLGHVGGLKPLYNALRDKDENVRGTVYEALGTLQMRLGKPLPAVQ